jgi:mannose-1-phosphate guanylyltransferase
VAAEADGRVLEFREKPTEPRPGWINAGTYVLEPSVLAAIPPGRAVSIERETFPSLIGAGERLYAFESSAYWMDVGTPAKYLRATFDALDGKVRGLDRAAPSVEPSARVSLRSHLGRWVVLCGEVEVRDDAVIEDSVVLTGATVGRGATVRDSIVGPGAIIEDGAVVDGAVLAEGARVPAGSVSRDGGAGAGRRRHT